MILTVARDEALRERVGGALLDTRWNMVVSDVETVGEAEQELSRPVPPSVVVVGASIGIAGASDLAARAATVRKPPAILLVGTPTTELLRTAMRAGIRDVLPPDFSGEDLIRAFEEAGVRSDGPEPTPGLTVAVFSTKGGVGTSVLAANLATRLGESTGSPSTLLDLDLASADQAIMHGLSPRWTIQDLADGQVGLDVESLEQVLLPIEGTTTRLLPGPLDPALAETITAGQVARVVAAARAEAPIAVLDTASAFDDRTLAALDAADVVVVTSSLDVAALRSLTVSLQTLRRLGIEDSSIMVVMVRSDSKSGLLVEDVERAINRPVDVGIPSTRSVPRSVNEGVPLAISSPRSNVVQAIDELVELLVARAPGELSVRRQRQSSLGGIFPWSRSRGDETPDAPDEPAAPTSDGAPASADLPASSSDPESPEASTGEDDVVVSDLPADIQPAGDAELDAGEADVPRRVHRRRVTRRVAGDDVIGPGEADGTEGDEVKDAHDVPTVRAVPSLDALPPPKLVTDDDDEQPRRRRRR